MKPNAIVKANGKLFDLNGLPISLRGTTAYLGVYFGDAGFQHGGQEVFVALTGLSEEERALTGKRTHLHHLSKHDNVLDAAYVAMKFAENREANMLKLKDTKTGEWDYGVLPKFEFEAIDTDKTRERRVSIIKKIRASKPKKAEVVLDNRLADANFDVLHSKYDIASLVAQFGRDTLLTARRVLTINEFELRFGLV